MAETLVLDFDGVIIDSIEECLETALEAYQAMYFPIKRTKIFEYLFYKYRYLVRPAAHFLYLLEAIQGHEDPKFNSKKLINNFCLKASNETKSEIDRKNKFSKFFFLSRELSRSQNKLRWLNMHKVYEQVLPILNQYVPKDIYVATMKDRMSVMVLLDHFKITIPSNNIYGNDFGENKKVHLEKILKQSEANHNEVTFIDDTPRHLAEVAELGINLGFASWGYGKLDNNIINLKSRFMVI